MKLLLIGMTIVLFCAVSACADVGRGSNMPIGGIAITSATQLTSPDEPRRLVSNLKAAVDKNMLMREDTFTQLALTHLTGGDEFRWDANTPSLKMVYVGHFPYSETGSNIRRTIFCTFQRSVDHDQGQIIIEDLVRSVSLPELLQLFGDNYVVGDAHAGERAHPTALNPATSSNGNKVFDYEFHRPGVETYIRITSDGDGTIKTISITQRGKP